MLCKLVFGCAFRRTYLNRLHTYNADMEKHWWRQHMTLIRATWHKYYKSLKNKKKGIHLDHEQVIDICISDVYQEVVLALLSL